MTLKLLLIYKSDRVYPSRFEPTYLILTELRKIIINAIEKHVAPRKNLTLVDYGCGNMPYKPFFEPYVSNYIGVDVPSHFDTGYTADVTIFTDEAGRVPDIADNSADIVFSIMVLEHVNDPALYLSECYRMLKPGGRLIISTLGYWVYHAYPVDYWRWTSPGLEKIIVDAGFKVLDMDGRVNLVPISLQLFQDGIVNKFPAALRPYFIFVMQFLMTQIEKFYSPYRDNRDAAEYIFVATKEEPAAES